MDILISGSSPRVRGTPFSLDHNMIHKRFIPACAGNTGGARSRAWGWSVHPRVCGEHRRRTIEGVGVVGSSPRVRGTRCQGSRYAGRYGFRGQKPVGNYLSFALNLSKQTRPLHYRNEIAFG